MSLVSAKIYEVSSLLEEVEERVSGFAGEHDFVVADHVLQIIRHLHLLLELSLGIQVSCLAVLSISLSKDTLKSQLSRLQSGGSLNLERLLLCVGFSQFTLRIGLSLGKDSLSFLFSALLCLSLVGLCLNDLDRLLLLCFDNCDFLFGLGGNLDLFKADLLHSELMM